MNFALVLAVLLAVAVGYLFHQLRLLQGEVHDIHLLAVNGVTLDELEQTIVPAVDELRKDTEAIRRNMAVLAAAVSTGALAGPEGPPPTPDDFGEGSDVDPDEAAELHGNDQLQALLSNVAAVFNNFTPPAEAPGGGAPVRVGVATTRVFLQPSAPVAADATVIIEEEDEDEDDVCDDEDGAKADEGSQPPRPGPLPRSGKQAGRR